MAKQQQGAQLDPSTHAGGGAIPNGDYDIVKARTGLFTYPGTTVTVPAILVTYKDAGVDYEQMYKAGDTDHLIPSEDEKRFVHPKGEAASIYKGGAASLWLGSLAKQGFQFAGDDVSQVENIRVSLESLPAPKGKSTENADRLIPMVTKIVKGKGATKPAARPPVTASATATSTAPSVNSSISSDEIETTAIQAVLQMLDAAPEKTMKVKGMPVRCLKAAQAINDKVKLNDLTKLITPDWLEATGEAAGWVSDGESVVGA